MSILESTKLNHEVFKNIQITSQENMIIKSLEKFYEDKNNINLFIPIINSESKISIRLIDHFVTKYSKNNKTNYKIKENEIEQTFNIHTSYKQQLKAFQKKHFDPFSRGDRVPYFMDESCVITTIGQLNFFRWFISKKVYDFVSTHQDEIENDMNRKNKIDKKKIKKETKVKKQKYSVQSCGPVTNTNTYSYKSYSPPVLAMAESKTDKIIVSFSF
jgi:hypothetical protein